MTSIYMQALGSEFNRLHPRIKERFGFSSADGIASVGRGVMDEIWYAKWATLPLYVGTFRHIMFPEGGRRIPFTIANYAYKDAFGRETVTWNRTFKFPNVLRKFDATMIYSQERRSIVDYLGNKQHLAVDLTIGAADNGGICIRSGAQRFYEGVVGFRFPAALTGVADVCEWFDDEERLFKITVEVTNPLLGPVFRYRGRFLAEFAAAERDRIPLEALPLREEVRE